MLDYKEQVESFKSSARFYLKNKDQYNKLASRKDEIDPQFLEYLHDDLMYVERTLNRVNAKCGSGARLLIYTLYVEGRSQSDVAKEYHMTRRQLQYSLSKWWKAVFEEDVPADMQKAKEPAV